MDRLKLCICRTRWMHHARTTLRYYQHITVLYIHRYCFGTKEIFYCRHFNFCTGLLVDHPKTDETDLSHKYSHDKKYINNFC